MNKRISITAALRNMDPKIKIVLPSYICLVKVFQFAWQPWGIIAGACAGSLLIIIMHSKKFRGLMK